MSANEKKLADFILDNASLIRDYSSQQIAASVGVSQSSVVKFSQKLGYKGFTDLKLAIHETVVKQETNVAVLRGQGGGRNDELSLQDRLYKAKCDAISGAADLNGDAAVINVAETVYSSPNVLFVGGGSANVIAVGLASRINALGKTVSVETDAEMQLARLRSFDRGDCLLIISAAGQAPHLGQLAKAAKKAGATVVSVTSQSANPVATLADSRLFSVSYGGDTEFSDIVSAVSQQHVADLVYCAIERIVRDCRKTSVGKRAARRSKAK